MKLLCFTWLVALCTLPAGAQRASLSPARVRDTLLARVLVEGEEVRLPSYGEQTPPLVLRLWRIGKDGACVDGTEAICSYHYYVAAGDYGEEAPVALYTLGEVGELTNVKWLPRPGRDAIGLRVTVVNWPASAMQYEKSLTRKTRVFDLVVTTDSISVRPVR